MAPMNEWSPPLIDGVSLRTRAPSDTADPSTSPGYLPCAQSSTRISSNPLLYDRTPREGGVTCAYALLEGNEPIMFRTWYRRAMKRRRIVKALFNSRGGVTILGDDAFVRATTEALELLKNKTPDVYALMQKHIGCVVSSKPTRVSSHRWCYALPERSARSVTKLTMRPPSAHRPGG